MNYCSSCGSRVELAIPEGDDRQRHVCPDCGAIHYQNPKMVTGCIPEWEGKILLCRRAIEPRYGYWTLPAGFMENDETVRHAAAREAREEALADVEIGSLLAVVDVIRARQVHIFYRAGLVGGRFGVGEETSASELVAFDASPWDDIAFPSVSFALGKFLEAPDNDGVFHTEF